MHGMPSVSAPGRGLRARMSRSPAAAASDRRGNPYTDWKRTRYSAPELDCADDQMAPDPVIASVPSEARSEPPTVGNAALRSMVPLAFIRKNRSGSERSRPARQSDPSVL